MRERPASARGDERPLPPKESGNASLVGDRTYALNHSELRNKGFQKKVGTRAFGVQDIMKMGEGRRKKRRKRKGRRSRRQITSLMTSRNFHITFYHLLDPDSATLLITA